MTSNVNLQVTDLHGRFYLPSYQGQVFAANVTAVTVPVIANNLVSVFALWNPPSSGINMELIDFDMGQVLATTVVDTVGLYGQSGAKALAATFTTLGTALSGIGADLGVASKGKFYSALTHSGTPTRMALIGAFGAVTNPTAALIHYEFDGRLLLPPGAVASVAMTTAAGTASGLDIGMRWAEWPI